MTCTFEQLIARYCARHGASLTPAQVTLHFDGDAMPPQATLAEKEIEEDDMIEVKVRT